MTPDLRELLLPVAHLVVSVWVARTTALELVTVQVRDAAAQGPVGAALAGRGLRWVLVVGEVQGQGERVDLGAQASPGAAPRQGDGGDPGVRSDVPEVPAPGGRPGGRRGHVAQDRARTRRHGP